MRGPRRRDLLKALAGLALGAPACRGSSSRGGGAASATASASAVTPAGPRKFDVVVVGAGMAGLTAARDLARGGRSVIVVEGRERIGGRLWTDRSRPGLTLDLGASWIHGPGGNPVAAIAKERGLRTFDTDWDAQRVFDAAERRALSGDERARVERLFSKVMRAVKDESGDADGPLSEAIDRAAQTLELSARERVELDYMVHLEIEEEFATDVSDLSRLRWDEGKEDRGGDLLLVDGYDHVLEALTPSLDVRLGHVVSRIAHDERGVRVETSRGAFDASRAVVTLPLGVLRAGAVTFDPPLPEVKVAAIAKLGFGVMNKLYLEFAKPFWPADAQVLGCIATPKGELALTMNMACLGKPVLLCFHSGEVARRIEAMTDDALVATAMTRMRAMFGVDIPAPVAQRVTRWGRDPFALGSYSHLPPGARPADRDALAAPVGDRLFFAGEATHRDHSATIRGAFESGAREAKRILAL